MALNATKILDQQEQAWKARHDRSENKSFITLLVLSTSPFLCTVVLMLSVIALLNWMFTAYMRRQQRLHDENLRSLTNFVLFVTESNKTSNERALRENMLRYEELDERKRKSSYFKKFSMSVNNKPNTKKILEQLNMPDENKVPIELIKKSEIKRKSNLSLDKLSVNAAQAARAPVTTVTSSEQADGKHQQQHNDQLDVIQQINEICSQSPVDEQKNYLLKRQMHTVIELRPNAKSFRRFFPSDIDTDSISSIEIETENEKNTENENEEKPTNQRVEFELATSNLHRKRISRKKPKRWVSSMPKSPTMPAITKPAAKPAEQIDKAVSRPIDQSEYAFKVSEKSAFESATGEKEKETEKALNSENETKNNYAIVNKAFLSDEEATSQKPNKEATDKRIRMTSMPTSSVLLDDANECGIKIVVEDYDNEKIFSDR
jgi:hypothetical protein